MRINCTSVEESNNKDYIKEEIKKLFPNYNVVVIPNPYSTIKGREKIRAYSKEYCYKNRVKQNNQRIVRTYQRKYGLMGFKGLKKYCDKNGNLKYDEITSKELLEYYHKRKNLELKKNKDLER